MRTRLPAILLPATLLLASNIKCPADITELYWDGPAITTPGVEGGSGTWDAGTSNWAIDGAGINNTTWSDGIVAIFGQTAGTVTLANGFTVNPNEIRFAENHYVITASGTGSILSTNLLIVTGASMNSEISAPITGSGTVDVNGALDSMLQLTGANTYTGTTRLNGGTLMIGDGNTGSITSNVEAATSTYLAFLQTSTYTYDGVISGDLQSLSIMGGGDVIFTGAHTFTGDTELTYGGHLFLDSTGSILGTVNAYIASVVGGIGTFNNIIVEDGATLAPGMVDSIGTLSVQQLTLNSGSTTEIQIAGLSAGTQHDQLLVSTDATLAGTLSVLLANGYTPNTGDTYDVMLADAFSGAYDSITSNNPLVSFLAEITADCEFIGCADILRLTATNTALQLRPLSYNARQMASAIDGERIGGNGGSFEPYLTDWIAMSDSELDEAMLRISPHRMASMLRANMQLMQIANTNFNNHMAMLRRVGVQSVARQPMGVHSESTILKLDPTRYGAWLEGSGSFADIDSLNYSVETGGAQAGIDYQLSPELTTGLFVGYHESETDLHSLGSEIEIEGSSLGLYAHYRPQGSAFYYQGMASFGVNDYDTRRNFIAAPDLYNAHGDTDGIQYDLNSTIGWERELGDYLLSVEGGLRYAAVDVDGYTESGAAPFNIAYLDQDAESLQSVLTTRISREHEIIDHKAVTELRVGWRHEFMDQTLTTSGSFAGGVGSPFHVRTPDFGADSAELGLGTTLLLDDSRSVSLGYDTQLSSDHSSHNISAMFRYNW